MIPHVVIEDRAVMHIVLLCGDPPTAAEIREVVESMPRENPSPRPIDPALYDAVVAEAKRRFDVWPSVYASSWVAKQYKRRGGEYAGARPERGLRLWYRERWVDLGRPLPGGGWAPCGRPKASTGRYPKCVPQARAEAMSEAERRDAVRRKRSAESEAPARKGRAPVRVQTKERRG